MSDAPGVDDAGLFYFAYGSNMLRERLEARIGPVRVIGPGRLADYRHGFSKLGADGTGKGNIERAPGAAVHGVLYCLSRAQMSTLTRFEGGYRQVSVSVQAGEDERSHVALTFEAVRPVGPLAPTDVYVAYYESGMREHRLPDAYREAVLKCARILMAGLR